MIPAQIHCIVVFPGEQIDPPPQPGLLSSPSRELLENDAARLYSVDRNKVIEVSDIQVDAEGRAQETLLAISSIDDIADGVDPRPWLSRWFGESGYTEFDEDRMKELYDICAGRIQRLRESVLRETLIRRKPHPVETDKLLLVSFLGMFGTSTSTEWESGHTELEDVYLVTTARIIPDPHPVAEPASANDLTSTTL